MTDHVTGDQVKRVTVEERKGAVEALRQHLYSWWASYVPPAVMASWTHDVDLFEAAVREDERERARHRVECRDCSWRQECDSLGWAREARHRHESVYPEHNVWILEGGATEEVSQ